MGLATAGALTQESPARPSSGETVGKILSAVLNYFCYAYHHCDSH